MKQVLLVITAILLLPGCVSFLPEPEAPDALYRLGPVEGDVAYALQKSVLVREPEAPRVLAGVDMATRDSNGAIRLVNGVEWADRAPRLFQLTLLDYFSAEGEGLAILPETGARADYEISWRISEFALQSQRAMARIEVTLLDGLTRKPLVQETFLSNVSSNGASAESRARAMSEAGRRVVQQTAEFVSQAVEAR